MINFEQQSALNDDGNVLLIAGPGSGKTFTITQKIIREIEKNNDKRKYIIAVTFTRIAAKEIKERVIDSGYSTEQLWVGTLHSFCLEWILRPYSTKLEELPLDFRAASEYEINKITQPIFDIKQLPEHSFTKDGYSFGPGKVPSESEIQSIQDYYKILYENNLITYDQILFYSYKILLENPQVPENLSRIFSNILIDEFQDTTLLQFQIISLISRLNRTKFFIVGDPNQAIFQNIQTQGLSKDSIEKLLQIKFSEYTLTENFRSSQKIIDFYKNFAVAPHEFNSANNLKNFDSKVIWDPSTSFSNLDIKICEIINSSINNWGTLPEDIAIVGPRWNILEDLHKKLLNRIPEIGFYGLQSSPFRGLSENFWYKVAILSLVQPSPSNYAKRLSAATDIYSFLVNNLDDVGDIGIFDILNSTSKFYEINESDSMIYLRKTFELFVDGNRIFSKIASRSPIRISYYEFFERFKENIRINSEYREVDLIKASLDNPGGVLMSTIHGVKGLEFDIVIGFGLLEGYVPHASIRIGSQEATDSAKRLLYVLTSRAKKHLYLISETNRKKYGTPTSQLRELFIPPNM